MTSGEDNSGLPGVNVVIKGNTIGASANAEGAYSIAVPDNLLKNAVLIYSFIGMKTSELTPIAVRSFPDGLFTLRTQTTDTVKRKL
ncbi:carboxypeptidase-like regulatory domain-containing protein [Spirosoma gilvum]